jgi:hypothetical protein
MLAFAALLLIAPLGARAASHLWRFEQFYSSHDRKVQFIVMREIGGSDIETNISEHWYATNTYNLGHTQLLGSDLPFGTANKAFLVGTQTYQAMALASPSLPDADYVLPDGFLNPNGDTVVWWFYQTLTIPPGVMPHDGYHSVRVVNPASPSGWQVIPNQPINFAGQTGSVPQVVPSQSSAALVLAGLLLLLASWFVRRMPLRA